MRARRLHYLAPELWPVMLVDDNGHANVVLGQERKRPLVTEPLTGFTREEAWQLQARLPGAENR